jgi:hypothetical protein
MRYTISTSTIDGPPSCVLCLSTDILHVSHAPLASQASCRVSSTDASASFYAITTDTSSCHHHVVNSTGTCALFASTHFDTWELNQATVLDLKHDTFDAMNFMLPIECKVRFGMEEQKKKSRFSNDISMARGPNWVLTPLKSASFEIRISSFVHPSHFENALWKVCF